MTAIEQKKIDKNQQNTKLIEQIGRALRVLGTQMALAPIGQRDSDLAALLYDYGEQLLQESD